MLYPLAVVNRNVNRVYIFSISGTHDVYVQQDMQTKDVVLFFVIFVSGGNSPRWREGEKCERVVIRLSARYQMRLSLFKLVASVKNLGKVPSFSC